MTTYTAGFAFYNEDRSVLLIDKKRGPPGVVGRKNAIGGKLKTGETPVQCQRREFREETGLDIQEERWTLTVILAGANHRDDAIYFFKTELTNVEAETYRTAEDEVVGLYDVREVPELNVVGNLRWLVPLQLDHHLQWPIEILEKP